MSYVDVILPLPLDGLFTYSVPAEKAPRVVPGVRLLVPLGKSKTYTAIAVELHERQPDFEARPILDVLDAAPVLLPQQLKLWQWIADYYLAPLGDVYKAALPAGLKAEEGFRPRTETYIALSESCRNEQTLHACLNMLTRATKQLHTFTTFLSLSHWDTLSGTAPGSPVVEVTREELMNASHCTAAVVKALVDRRFLFVYEKTVGRLNVGGEPRLDSIQSLSLPQQDAYNQIVFQFLNKPVVLLHGVTSSGKTEVYIHLIRKALEERKQVLYLLPEIALTVQITTRLQRIFGNRMAVYHSKYSDAERVEIWNKQLSAAPYDIILGARSAVFLPFRNLGLVIVDEEHETSFKQQDPAPRYHARSAAIMLARMCGARTLLGTATPSMESYYNAHQGKYGLVGLMTRYRDIRLPEIRVVDIKDLQRRKMMNGPFSPDLLQAVRQALHDGRQVILFQNRRGFAPMVECRTCGWVPSAATATFRSRCTSG